MDIDDMQYQICLRNQLLEDEVQKWKDKHRAEQMKHRAEQMEGIIRKKKEEYLLERLSHFKFVPNTIHIIYIFTTLSHIPQTQNEWRLQAADALDKFQAVDALDKWGRLNLKPRTKHKMKRFASIDLGRTQYKNDETDRVNDKLRRTENRLHCAESRLHRTENTLQRIERDLQKTAGKLKSTEFKLQVSESWVAELRHENDEIKQRVMLVDHLCIGHLYIWSFLISPL